MADVVNPVLLRYATALYQLVSAGGAGAVATAGGQLDALAHNVAHNEELRIHLAAPRLGRESKRRLLSHVLGAQTGDAVRRTVMLLVDKGRASEVGGLAASFHTVARKAEGRETARVTSATALDDGQRAQLVAELQRLTGLTITLDESVDPALIGGLRVVLGSKMIDGSLARRLAALGENLFRAPVGAGR